jgi:hypothetical protein
MAPTSVTGAVTLGTGAMMPATWVTGANSVDTINPIVQEMRNIGSRVSITSLSVDDAKRIDQLATENPALVQDAFERVSLLEHKAKACMDILISHGADINAAAFSKKTTSCVLKMLFTEYDVDINAPDAQGKTILHHYIEKDHVHIVCTLMALGADINIQDSEGRNVLQLAQTLNMTNIAKRIQKADYINKQFSPKEAKIIKAIVFVPAWNNDDEFKQHLDRAADIAHKISSYDQTTKDFIIKNNQLIDLSLEADFKKWSAEKMMPHNVLVNLAYHHGDKITGIADLWGAPKVSVVSFLDHIPVDQTNEVGGYSTTEHSARVLSKAPSDSFGGISAWKKITSYLSPHDIELKGATATGSSASSTNDTTAFGAIFSDGEVQLTGVNILHPGDGMTYGPADADQVE